MCKNMQVSKIWRVKDDTKRLYRWNLKLDEWGKIQSASGGEIWSLMEKKPFLLPIKGKTITNQSSAETRVTNQNEPTTKTTTKAKSAETKSKDVTANVWHHGPPGAGELEREVIGAPGASAEKNPQAETTIQLAAEK